MKRVNFKIHRTILFLCILPGSLFSESLLAAQYWGITDNKLPYIAKVRAQAGGHIVVYNPDTCDEIGVACGFFVDHASAHAHLNHRLMPPEAYTTMSEDQADCWVAKNGKPEEVYAAVQLLLDENRNPNVNITGDPALRAEKIRACAEQAGNWYPE
jgi:hypothetical protein